MKTTFILLAAVVSVVWVPPAQAEQADTAASQAGLSNPQTRAVISFKETVYDFGQVAPGSENLCEFEFSNSGDATLKIIDIGKSCGCTPVTLEKTVYEPGESGTLKVKYHASIRPGAATKRLYVKSNDPANPRLTLTIKSEVAEKVTYEPRNLRLVVNRPNGGCPDITLKSLDGRDFAVTGFKSPGDSITFEIDPGVKAEQFVITPKLDLEKIQSHKHGRLEIELTHPYCKKVTIPFSLVPRFALTPASLNLIRSEPLKAVQRKLYLFSNYDEKIEIESTSSKEGLIKVLRQEQIDRNRYRLVLEITPPQIESDSRMFRDMFYVTVNGEEQLQVPCVGYYDKKWQSRAMQQDQGAAANL